MKKALFIPIVASIVLCFGTLAYAKEYKVAIKDLPTASEFVAMIKEIIEASGNTASIQVVPQARADYMVSNNEVDLQYPIIVIPDVEKQKNLKYDLSSIELLKSAWVLYTNKKKPIDPEPLRKGNPNNHRIETDPSRLDDFTFAAIGSTNYEASFKKLDTGTIDGIILSQSTGDSVLKKLGLKTIKRQFWFEYVRTFSLPKGARGGEIDKMLSAGLEKLKTTGRYEVLIGKQAQAAKYDDWQP
jgi:polar amino acid transport system substrate-binding protein